MEKKKKYLILGIIILLVLGGVTVAYLTWISDKVNIGLNSDCFTIDYTKGGDINNASVKLMDERDLIDSNNKFTIKDGIALTYANISIKSTCGIEGYGSLYLNITSLSDAFTTGNSVGALKYAVLTNTSTNTVSVANLLDQSFDIEKKGSITSTGTKKILTKRLSNTEVNKYIIVIYIDKSLSGNDVIGSSFSGKISADANQGKMDANYTLQKLHSLNSTIVVDTSKTPDFATVSGNNGIKVDGYDNILASNLGDGTNGIYAAEDDLGTSYYFRGNVTNNYVKFANKYWRIIRINGDGSIRMIYAGTSAHPNGYDDSSTGDMIIGSSKFNSSYNDNAYVGYMYGTAGSSTYDETHANINDSTIKTVVDNWYYTNIVNTDNEQYIADAIYCNDRKVINIDNVGGMTLTGNGTGTSNSAYAGFDRVYVSHKPSLKCENKNDRFTVNNTIGNMALSFPIALATNDELMYAGGVGFDPTTMTFIVNDEFYLYTNNFYWTMTSFAFAGGSARVVDVFDVGDLDYDFVYGDNGVRPVVSLHSDAISDGSGTINDPFVVGYYFEEPS